MSAAACLIPPDASPLGARLATAARDALRRQRPAEALPLLDRLTLLPGQAIAAALLRAEALLGLGRGEAAEAQADVALSAGEDAAARQWRARIRLSRGNRLGALDDAAAGVMAAPSDPHAKALLGACLIEAKRFDEAIWFLGAAFAAEPDNPMVQLRLAQAFALGGRHAAAEELLAHCRAASPDLAGADALWAQIPLLEGRPAEAEARARATLARRGPSVGVLVMLAHALVDQDRRAEAGPHFTAAARLSPGDPYLAHLAASAAGMAAGRAPDGYVAAVFDSYAPRFEASLIALGYRGPGLIRRTLERLRPALAGSGAKLGPLLDLGCGTGLVAVTLGDLLGPTVIGIDLSRGMLNEAAAKGLYSELHEAELLVALAAETRAFDVIVAADVFCYFGDLAPALAACRARLAPGGVLLFTVEHAETAAGVRLDGSGRYAHGEGFVRAALAAAGLRVVECRPEQLRRDRIAAIEALVVVATGDA